jgi:hypothetical protein
MTGHNKTNKIRCNQLHLVVGETETEFKVSERNTMEEFNGWKIMGREDSRGIHNQHKNVGTLLQVQRRHTGKSVTVYMYGCTCSKPTDIKTTCMP